MHDPLLLDTAPLRDQRTMVDVGNVRDAHRTIQDVEQAWQRWATREGLTYRRRAGDFSTELRTSKKTVEIFISEGKWIGECPTCNGGVPGWPFHMRGCCLDCGTIYKLDYPSADEIAELVDLMTARPVKQRNFHRHKGETLEFVKREQAILKFSHDEQGGLIRVADLKDILSVKAFRELQDAGLA